VIIKQQKDNYFRNSFLITNNLKNNQMKKDGITIMLIGLGLTILTAIFYFTNHNEYLMNKFIITFGHSFHFNWAPMIGILTMAFGEFILWKSQNNKNMSEVMDKFILKSKMMISTLKLELNAINFKELRLLIMSFKL